MFSLRCIMVSIVVLISFVSFCNGLVLKRHPNLTTLSISNDTRLIQCGFVGDTDVLGVGIRIGYYTQALAVWFANYFILSEAKVLRSINLLFLIALFVGLVWLSHNPEQTYAVQVCLLLQLLFVTWSVGVLDRSKFSKKLWRNSYMWVIIREASWLCFLSYSVWFAWIGLDRFEPTPCGTFVFFIAKVSLYGWYRSAFKVLSIVFLCLAALKQVDTALQISQRQQSNPVRSPDYFSRLQQSLLGYNEMDFGTVEFSQSNGPRFSASLARTYDLEVLEIAAQTALPMSPPLSRATPPNSSQAADPQYTSSPKLHPNNANFPSLEDLIAAEYYLQDIIDVNVSDHSSWCYEIKWLSLKVFLPSIHSPKVLYQRFTSLISVRPFRLPILIPLYRHVRSMSRYPVYSYLIMIEKTLHHPYHQEISRTTLLAAIAFHEARLPPHRPKANVLYHAGGFLSMCIMLILGIELAIRWNSITGLGNFGAVGQLVPAIIGVGGLVKVVWSWWSKGDTSEDEVDRFSKDLKECIQVYEKLKKKREAAGTTVVAETA
ncbi:hypothetical protein N7G274_002567 [Stereocaulon virgatum]|uniref:Uncharacterized protein n=1 Tax=Stereocaulon virgatum TaxID=373712 RepID=A0ABR4AJF1_9LECA